MTWQPTPVLLSRESHGQRSLGGYSPWSCKELDKTEHAHTCTHTHTHTHIHTHTHTPHCGVLWLAFECWGVIQLKLKWDLVSENQGAGSGSTAVFCDLGQVFSQSLNFLICKILLMTIHMLLKGSNVVKVVKAPLKSCKCHFPST